MERLTQKNEFFEYVLPEQNIFGDNQAYEISLGETEYTCKLHITGEAIKRFGELEDVLEKWHIENLEELKTRLHDCQVYRLENNSNETLIHNLKNELAELKQNAIVPKFKIGQKVWWIDTRVNSFNEQRYRIDSYLIDSIVITKEQFRYYGDDGLWLGDNELFATKEEAEQKLAEIGGKDDRFKTRRLFRVNERYSRQVS